jgi:hypothetical protein
MRLFRVVQSSYPDCIIIADRDQNIKQRVPLHHLDVLCVPLQHRHTLVLIPRLHLPYPRHLVPAACREQRPGRAPRHALHLVLVPLRTRSGRVSTRMKTAAAGSGGTDHDSEAQKLTSRVATHSKSPPLYSHTAVVASKLAVASSLPSGDQAQDLTVRLCVSSSTS